MYYITPERDLARMDLKSLENLKAETERDIDTHDCNVDIGGGGACHDHAKLNFYLERINKWIEKIKAGEEFIKIKQEKRDEELDHCGYDDIILANNIF